jgi:hypothetical protein
VLLLRVLVPQADVNPDRLLILLPLLPQPAGRAGDADDVTQPRKVTCTYHEMKTGQVVTVGGEDVAVQRPVEVAKDNQKPNMEVAREKFRVEATEDIMAARTATERGDHVEASRRCCRSCPAT